MAHTYRHEWKYRAKRHLEHWKHEEIHVSRSEVDGLTVEIRYLMEEPKDRSFNPPEYFYNIWMWDKAKKWVKKTLWHKHRRQWKNALHNLDFNKMERLNRRPERYEWIIW